MNKTADDKIRAELYKRLSDDAPEKITLMVAGQALSYLAGLTFWSFVSFGVLATLGLSAWFGFPAALLVYTGLRKLSKEKRRRRLTAWMKEQVEELDSKKEETP